MRFKQLQRITAYPEGAGRGALARFFYVIAGATLVVLSVAAVNNLVFGDAGVLLSIAVALLVVGALIAAAYLGQVRIASALLPLVALAGATHLFLSRDGVHDTAVLAIAGALVAGGILLSRAAMAAFTVAALCVILGVGYAEMAGVLHNRLSAFTDWRHLVGICLAYVFIAITVCVLTESLLESSRETRRQAAAFAKMVQASPSSITISRLEDGTFVEANEAALELFGRSRTELIGHSAAALGLWPDPQERAALIEQVSAQGGVRLRPFTLRRKSGETRELLISAALIEIERQPLLLISAVDFTDIARAQRLLRQSEERFAKIFQASPDAIVITRLEDGRYLEVNRSWLEIFGYSREELIGRSSLDLGIWAEPSDRARFVAQVREHGSVRGFEARLRKKSGAIIEALLCAEAIEIDGAPHIIAPLLDITERKRAEERIRHLATRDALTGLPNRLLFADRLALAIAAAQRHNGRLALLFIDLDRFKYINDSLGHVIGDAFLKSVAERLGGIMRKGDTLARLGGDEFVVLLEDIDVSEDAAGQVARKTLQSFAEPFRVEGHTLSCSCSIGISLYPADTVDPHMLLRDADTAMYHVKEGGRGSYRYFSAEMNARMLERLQIENGLRDAVARRQLTLAYQPKVGVASGAVVGFEALLRWRHPDWGVIAPQRFIAIAEDTGLIVDIGQWVMREVCAQLRDWSRHGLALRPVAVNLSVRQLAAPLIAEVSTLIAEFGIEPGLIEFEVTESLLMKEPEQIGAILRGLAGIGVHVTIDDFGVGYSSLNYIRHLLVSGLKLDRSFVGGITHGPRDVAIVQAVIGMARGLGMRVVAEGVETRGQLELLRDLHCDEYQGFLFSEPLDPGELERRYLSRT